MSLIERICREKGQRFAIISTILIIFFSIHLVITFRPQPFYAKIQKQLSPEQQAVLHSEVSTLLSNESQLRQTFREVQALKQIEEKVTHVKHQIRKLKEYKTFSKEKLKLMGNLLSGFLHQHVDRLKERELENLDSESTFELENSFDLSQIVRDASVNQPKNKACSSIPITAKVGLILPVTSKGVSEYSEAVMFKTFLPSLIASGSKGYHYRLYLAYNEGDGLFGNSPLLKKLFNQVKEQTGFSCAKHGFRVDYRAVKVPSSIKGSTALSILFAVPTLAAYHDNSDYFYLANDDLKLVSPKWTEQFISALKNNPVYENLGIVGGIDISGPQPFLEFPFFHRTHVEIFPSFGAHPWVFRNWFEDNWINDVYLPWSSIFYLKNIKVSNYEGLNLKEERYEVKSKDTPKFYISEVEKGRQQILSWLQQKLGKNSPYSTPDFKIGYCDVPHSSLYLMVASHQEKAPNSKLNHNPCDFASHIYDAASRAREAANRAREAAHDDNETEEKKPSK